MKFATYEEVEAFSTKIETIKLTEREENIVTREFGEILPRENYINFAHSIDSTIFFGYAGRYLRDRTVYAKVDTFDKLKNIDQKIGLFNNEDVLCVALFYFAYDILDKHFKVTSTIYKLLPYNLFLSMHHNFPSNDYHILMLLI